MIKLRVEPYCQDCPYFEPLVIKSEYTRDTEGGLFHTDICCESHRKCENIALRVMNKTRDLLWEEEKTNE